MPLFPFTYEHENGSGGGTVTARSKKAAAEKISAELQQSHKLTNLKVDVGDETTLPDISTEVFEDKKDV